MNISYPFCHLICTVVFVQKLAKHQAWILALPLSSPLSELLSDYAVIQAQRQLHKRHKKFCKFHTLLPAKKPWAQIRWFGLSSLIPIFPLACHQQRTLSLFGCSSQKETSWSHRLQGHFKQVRTSSDLWRCAICMMLRDAMRKPITRHDGRNWS